MSTRKLVLASASPSRAAILRGAGVNPEIMVSNVDESSVLARAEPTGVAEAVSILAQAKAVDVATHLRDPSSPALGRNSLALGRDSLVLGCDSLLSFDGEQYGKPASSAEALHRWQRMRGKSAVLYSGHHLIHQDRHQNAVGSTTVHFADISDAELQAYIASGEPLHVAGAFTIDGLAGPFIERIEGDHHNVLGLSLPLLRVMLQEWGIMWHDLWSTH